MKFNKFAYLYSKPIGNHTLKITKKIPGNLLKKPGNIMEFCQSEKVGTLSLRYKQYFKDVTHIMKVSFEFGFKMF